MRSLIAMWVCLNYCSLPHKKEPISKFNNLSNRLLKIDNAAQIRKLKKIKTFFFIAYYEPDEIKYIVISMSIVLIRQSKKGQLL